MYMYKHWNKSIWIHIEWPINKAFILPYPLYQWAFDVIMWNPHLRYGDPTANTEIKGSLSWVGGHMCINLCRYLKSLTTIGKVLRTGKNIWTLVSDWVIASLTDMMQKKNNSLQKRAHPPDNLQGNFCCFAQEGWKQNFTPWNLWPTLELWDGNFKHPHQQWENSHERRPPAMDSKNHSPIPRKLHLRIQLEDFLEKNSGHLKTIRSSNIATRPKSNFYTSGCKRAGKKSGTQHFNTQKHRQTGGLVEGTCDNLSSEIRSHPTKTSSWR